MLKIPEQFEAAHRRKRLGRKPGVASRRGGQTFGEASFAPSLFTRAISVPLARHPRPPLAREITTVLSRAFAVGTAIRLRRAGKSQSEIARETGCSIPSLFRWERSLRTGGGLAALLPHYANCGRTSSVDLAGITPAKLELLRTLVLVRGSVARGCQLFSATPDCPRPLARAIRNGRLPTALRRLLPLYKAANLRCCAGRCLLVLPKGDVQ